MSNAELIQKAQAILVKMAEIVNAHDAGQITIAGENISIDDQVKINMKQSFNAKRADLIKALNDVKLQ